MSRIVQRDPQEKEFAFHGVYHEVTINERIINTFEYEGLPEKGHVILETKIFEELPGGKMKLTMHDVYQSIADRDGMVASGMEGGLRESIERLDEILVKINN